MIAKKSDITKDMDVRIILDNIRSVFNVGSIFRTAETLGIKKIYCVGITPTPLDRFGRKRKDLAKVALGAEDILVWEHVKDDGITGITKSVGGVATLIKRLKKEKFKIIALEQAPNAVDYKDVKVNTRKNNFSNDGHCTDKAVVILGNEVDGVSADLLELADVVAEISMAGQKESLNVSVAGAVFLFRLLDK